MKKRPNRPAYKAFLFFFLLIPVASIDGQNQAVVAPPSKSDTYAVDESGKKVRVQRREVAGTNFRISGVDLASDEEVLLQAANLLGKAPTTWSGDASTSDEEACYRSGIENDNTHLIFGRGELDSSFILSSDGSAWRGNGTCTQSVRITRNLATNSGLHLGLTERQVIGILGLATSRRQNIQQHRDKLAYSLEARKKTDPQKLAQRWQQEIKKNPGADHGEFLRNYEFYELEVEIDAKFIDNSLTNLYVSWSAQY